jgi:hypothetical protein
VSDASPAAARLRVTLKTYLHRSNATHFLLRHNSHSLWHVQVSREKLVALGTQIGKWTHSGKFRLGIGALDLLAQHAKHKVRLRPVMIKDQARIDDSVAHAIGTDDM